MDILTKENMKVMDEVFEDVMEQALQEYKDVIFERKKCEGDMEGDKDDEEEEDKEAFEQKKMKKESDGQEKDLPDDEEDDDEDEEEGEQDGDGYTAVGRLKDSKKTKQEEAKKKRK